MSDSPVTDPNDVELTERITASQGRDDIVVTTLKTDGRVLARITDGIYRQPASAIRELISNAYDADATRVIITTDRPRFSRITVEDDGAGMSPDAVVHLLHHIGGSAKRSLDGISLNLTQSDDVTLSPGGRRLIGKIGIGLFSIAQLTHTFQIITKTKGDDWRTVASVALRQYSDQELADSENTYEAGLVSIWQEPASDIDVHGTTVVLDQIRPKTKETLQSAGLWLRVDEETAVPPRYHIGHYQPTEGDSELRRIAGEFDHVPWRRTDDPSVAFDKLVRAVWQELDIGYRNPKLEQIFDYYLRMVWDISLAVPIPYVDGHPFDIPFDKSTLVYELPGNGPGTARQLNLTEGETVRQRLQLPDAHSESSDFRVIMDDLELRRPLIFTGLPTTSNLVKTPMFFAGQLHEDFAGVDSALSGGPLEFQAYLLWTPKIAPVDDAGVLVRVHGASGTLFDQSFLRYQVAEPTRLRQISCEIFVTKGVDAAINLDRESFNYAHPHIVRLTSWLHSALTRTINQQKLVASAVRRESREAGEQEAGDAIAAIVSNAWNQITGDDDDVPPVILGWTPGEPRPGAYVFNRNKVLGDLAYSDTIGARRIEREVAAIVQVLSAYQLLDTLDPEQREDLARFIAAVLQAGA